MAVVLDVLRLINVAAFAALAFVTYRLWTRRQDRPTFWMALTFADLAIVALAARILEDYGLDESSAGAFAEKLIVAALLLFPYLLFRVADAFTASERLEHLAAAIPTGIVVVWGILVPRLPDPGEARPAWFQAFVFAILVQWVLCSSLVAIRFWRGGTGQPAVTRKRMRTLAIASVILSVAIVISGSAPGEHSVVLDVVVQLVVLVSVVAFFLSFAPPAWLRASWRRESEENARRAIVDLMSAEDDDAVVDALLPHAVTLVGAEAIAMFDTEGQIVGSYGTQGSEWKRLQLNDEDALIEAGFTKMAFPFGCLLVKTTPFTLFFGRDEVDLLGALGVMTNLALERVRASEMRLQLAGATIRRHQALEINDNVVQGLAVAKYAFDLGDEAKAKQAIEGTLAAARRIISDLLDEVGADEVFGPNALTRETPATGFVKKSP